MPAEAFQSAPELSAGRISHYHRWILIARLELRGERVFAERLSELFDTTIDDGAMVIEEKRLPIPSKDNETNTDDSKQGSDAPKSDLGDPNKEKIEAEEPNREKEEDEGTDDGMNNDENINNIGGAQCEFSDETAAERLKNGQHAFISNHPAIRPEWILIVGSRDILKASIPHGIGNIAALSSNSDRKPNSNA